MFMPQPGAEANAGGQVPPATNPEGGNPTPPATVTPPNAPDGTAVNDDVAFEGDENQWDEKTKGYIQRLRKENAKYRTKAKTGSESQEALQRANALESGLKKLLGIEGEVTPEEQVQMLESQHQQSEFNGSILELALEHEIPKDKVKYFKFLVSEAVGQLAEGQEMTDEALEQIIKDVKASGGAKPPAAGTSVATPAGKTPAPGASGEVSLESFVKMNIGERSLLHSKNAALYQKLFEEAKLKKLL